MKYSGYLLLIIMLASSALYAQNEADMQKIQSARIALITERLDLTPEQAEKFWPLYREFLQERSDLRQELQQARGNVRKEDLTEEQSKELLELGLRLKEREAQLDRKYSERLSKVIDSRQILALRKAEEDFRRMLLQRIDEQRELRQRIQDRKRSIDN